MDGFAFGNIDIFELKYILFGIFGEDEGKRTN
jgi:hypothetical protein